MMIKRTALSLGVLAITFILLILLNYVPSPQFTFSVSFETEDICQVFEGEKNPTFTDVYSKSYPVSPGTGTSISYAWNKELVQARIDFGSLPQKVLLEDIGLTKWNLFVHLHTEQILYMNEIEIIQEENGIYQIQSLGNDPYIIFSTEAAFDEYSFQAAKRMRPIFFLAACLTSIVVFIQYKRSKILIFWALDILKSFTLIAELAASDFKTKYAASYLGIVWAFIQPIVTISIYVVVFGYGFKSTPIKDFPFVLWLSAGIIPWLFFSDALMSSTASLKEYSYLVKKVVFEVKVLPLVKIMASFYIHLVFIVIVMILYFANGYMPDLYDIQLIYYAFCTLILTLGISYITSALNVFVPDLIQIVNIFLQFGMWMTPIMWSSNMFGPQVAKIIQINPLYYIVEGYRDCFYNHALFWEKPGLTIYFWCIALILLVLGMYTFKKLERHFADVL